MFTLAGINIFATLLLYGKRSQLEAYSGKKRQPLGLYHIYLGLIPELCELLLIITPRMVCLVRRIFFN